MSGVAASAALPVRERYDGTRTQLPTDNSLLTHLHSSRRKDGGHTRCGTAADRVGW